ncbi:MAG: hypothetical protein ACRDY6_08195, partial [Acidimicrobiia bacterium]
PGLRTITVVAAGGSGLSARRALPALVLGSSVFLQLHVFLGYFLGEPARELIDRATVPAMLAVGVLAIAAAVFWFARRGRRGGAQAWAEAACPACLVLGAAGERVALRYGHDGPEQDRLPHLPALRGDVRPGTAPRRPGDHPRPR